MIKKHLAVIVSGLVFAVLLNFSSFFLFSATVFAADIPAGCPGSTMLGPPAPGVCESIPAGCAGTTQTGPPAPNFNPDKCPYGPTLSQDKSCTVSDNTSSGQCLLFQKYLIPIINFLAGAVGIICTIMIVVGGVQYSAAGGDPQKVTAGKQRVFNAIYALLAFLFLYAFLNWIVPGGIFPK